MRLILEEIAKAKFIHGNLGSQVFVSLFILLFMYVHFLVNNYV